MKKIMWIAVAMVISAGMLAADGKDAKKEGPPSPRFSVPAGKTNCVLDNLTGLTWARKASLTGTNQLTWAQAVAFCKELNHDGLTGWRLPTFKELSGLIEAKRSEWAQSKAAGDARWKTWDHFTGVMEYLNGPCYYWATTTTAGEPGGAWLITPQGCSGQISSDNERTGSGYVWPVRGGK